MSEPKREEQKRPSVPLENERPLHEGRREWSDHNSKGGRPNTDEGVVNTIKPPPPPDSE